MAVTTITIPYPIISSGNFDVVIIDDATGTNAFTGSETNTSFDVTLAQGCYTMSTTYNGNTTFWCFCVPADCDCAPYVSSVITQPTIAGIRYLQLTFDTSGWAFCPFNIEVMTVPFGTTYHINSLADLTHVSGTTYTFTAYVGNVSGVAFKIFKGVNANSSVCVSQFVSYACEPALLADPHHPTSIFTDIVEVGSDWFIRLRFFSCGDSCHSFTINYDEHYYTPSVGLDVGSATITLDCADPSPWETLVPINPFPSFYIGRTSGIPGYEYHMVIKDCCGNTVFNAITQSSI